MTGLGAIPVAPMPDMDTVPMSDGGPESRDPCDEWVTEHLRAQVSRVMLATTQPVEIPEHILRGTL